MVYLFYFFISILLLLGYFKIAEYFNIIDKPNHRSSHKHLTILGGGIIFPVIICLHALIYGISYPYFTLGLILISLVSFYDDIKPLSFSVRLLSHLIAVALMFFETGLINYQIWLIILFGIIVIGTLNAYNFMDGINGLTGVYSLLTILSLIYINEYNFRFVSSELLIIVAISLISFNIFNFRSIAKCFAGDVGSVSMAFIIIFFISTLIIESQDFKYIGLLLIYGLDSVTTIIFRLLRRENIFLAHRSHFYQYLVNNRSLPHLIVSSGYALVQLMVNFLILYRSFEPFPLFLFILAAGLMVVFIRITIEGKTYLLKVRRSDI